MLHEQDEIILTVGQFQPPILLGEPNERVEQARQLGELLKVLQDHVDKYDEAKRKHD